MIPFSVLMVAPFLLLLRLLLHSQYDGDEAQQEDSYDSKAYAYFSGTTAVAFCAC